MEIILTCGIVPEPWHCFPPTFVLCFSKANSFQYFLKTHLGSKINASEAQRVSCWFWFFLSCFVFMTCPEQRLTRLSSLPKSLEVRPLLFLHTLLLEEKHTFHYAELIACLTDDPLTGDTSHVMSSRKNANLQQNTRLLDLCLSNLETTLPT